MLRLFDHNIISDLLSLSNIGYNFAGPEIEVMVLSNLYLVFNSSYVWVSKQYLPKKCVHSILFKHSLFASKFDYILTCIKYPLKTLYEKWKTHQGFVPNIFKNPFTLVNEPVKSANCIFGSHFVRCLPIIIPIYSIIIVFIIFYVIVFPNDTLTAIVC